MIELNAVGWAAVLAPGAVLGGLAGLFTRRPISACAVVGAATSWLSALTIDAVRWRSSEISMRLPGELADEETERVVRALKANGVGADVREETDPGTGERHRYLVTTMRFRHAADECISQVTDASEASEHRGE